MGTHSFKYANPFCSVPCRPLRAGPTRLLVRCSFGSDPQFWSDPQFLGWQIPLILLFHSISSSRMDSFVRDGWLTQALGNSKWWRLDFFSSPGKFPGSWARLPGVAGRSRRPFRATTRQSANRWNLTVHLSVHSGVNNYCLMHIDQRKPMSRVEHVQRLHQRPRASKRASEWVRTRRRRPF